MFHCKALRAFYDDCFCCCCTQTLYEKFAAEKEDSGKEKLLLTLATASSDFYVSKSYEAEKIYKCVS